MLPKAASGPDSALRPCRLDVRFAQKRTRLGEFMSTRPSLTPLADLGRSAGQRPLHGLHAAGIAAAGDDAEIGARLLRVFGLDRSLAWGRVRACP